jgi:nondiscriminating aspartyl-tRNA synthetase
VCEHQALVGTDARRGDTRIKVPAAMPEAGWHRRGFPRLQHTQMSVFMEKRAFVAQLPELFGQKIRIAGWVSRYRPLAKTAFIVLQDCSGTVQCVAAPDRVKDLALKLDDVVEVVGAARAEPRSKQGYEFDVESVRVLNRSGTMMPFNSSSDISAVGQETLLDYRPLSLRVDSVNRTFRVQAEIVHLFREFLRAKRFTEIITSKIVSGGTEGGTNLFPLKYFERTAYLAQSPQLYKEYGVAGFERVFETGHVYRAEPHATSRHLTEYYSLDLELGFIDSVLDVIELERELLSYVFAGLNAKFALALPSMERVPVWTFQEAVRKLGKPASTDDLDGEMERQLCALAEKECGVPSVFVVGYPSSTRPFYTAPGAEPGVSAGFDLLFRGMEITSGGQRLHTREALELAITAKGMKVEAFAEHLRMYELGMPPHGGLAIGLERLTMLCLGLPNVREATMYPRDRNRIAP